MATQQESYGQIANYNISPGTRADGQSSALEVDSKGNLLTNIQLSGNPVIIGQQTSANSIPVVLASDKSIVSAGSDFDFQRINAYPKFLPFFFNATNTGQSVYIQGNRILGGVKITQAGSPGMLLKIYDNYYQAVTQKYQFDASFIADYHPYGLFVAGIYIVISGSGNAPCITLEVA